MTKAKKPRSARAEIKMWKGQVAATQAANAKLRDELSVTYEKIVTHSRKEDNLANENSRLSKLIESLKEQLFHKSIALAQAEGQLQRVDHEDAERAEVVFVQDYKLTRLDHRSGNEVAGPPIQIQKAVLKYDLARAPLRTTTYEPPYERALGSEYNRISTEKPKHWVNQG